MMDLKAAWSQQYQELVNRNVGFISLEQQERLRTCKAAVLGVGGLGGTAFEVLVRCGIGRFSIVDRDVFEPTNMNRQVFAYRDTLGRKKIDVAAEWAREINADAEIQRFDHVDEDNIADIFQDADVAVMAIDTLAPCIVASRKARELGIALVEGWALPYTNVRVFTPGTPTLEEAYGLPTKGRRVADISEGELKEMGLKVLMGLKSIEGVADYYSEEVLEGIRRGRIVSFAPVVWLTAVQMALEAIKVLLRWGRLALSPDFSLYDPFQHRIPRASQ
jgi:molybdopterin/thiamine biosynthesis adenylyltransferase